MVTIQYIIEGILESEYKDDQDKINKYRKFFTSLYDYENGILNFLSDNKIKQVQNQDKYTYSKDLQTDYIKKVYYEGLFKHMKINNQYFFKEIKQKKIDNICIILDEIQRYVFGKKKPYSDWFSETNNINDLIQFYKLKSKDKTLLQLLCENYPSAAFIIANILHDYFNYQIYQEENVTSEQEKKNIKDEYYNYINAEYENKTALDFYYKYHQTDYEDYNEQEDYSLHNMRGFGLKTQKEINNEKNIGFVKDIIEEIKNSNEIDYKKIRDDINEIPEKIKWGIGGIDLTETYNLTSKIKQLFYNNIADIENKQEKTIADIENKQEKTIADIENKQEKTIADIENLKIYLKQLKIQKTIKIRIWLILFCKLIVTGIPLDIFFENCFDILMKIIDEIRNDEIGYNIQEEDEGRTLYTSLFTILDKLKDLNKKDIQNNQYLDYLTLKNKSIILYTNEKNYNLFKMINKLINELIEKQDNENDLTSGVQPDERGRYGYKIDGKLTTINTNLIKLIKQNNYTELLKKIKGYKINDVYNLITYYSIETYLDDINFSEIKKIFKGIKEIYKTIGNIDDIIIKKTDNKEKWKEIKQIYKKIEKIFNKKQTCGEIKIDDEDELFKIIELRF